MKLRATLCVTVVALIGCGGGRTDAEYAAEMRAAMPALIDEMVVGFGWVDVEGVVESANLARRLARGFDRTARRFDAIDPPENVEADHEALVEALRRFATENRRFAASGARDQTAFERASEHLDEIDQRLAAIQRKYDIGWRDRG